MPMQWKSILCRNQFDVGGVREMKGYQTHEGYMGYVNGRYILFSTETEYKEYYKEIQKNV